MKTILIHLSYWAAIIALSALAFSQCQRLKQQPEPITQYKTVKQYIDTCIHSFQPAVTEERIINHTVVNKDYYWQWQQPETEPGELKPVWGWNWNDPNEIREYRDTLTNDLGKLYTFIRTHGTLLNFEPSLQITQPFSIADRPEQEKNAFYLSTGIYMSEAAAPAIGLTYTKNRSLLGIDYMLGHKAGMFRIGYKIF
jgi:hypothetical protein